jgi:hypothetical protein
MRENILTRIIWLLIVGTLGGAAWHLWTKMHPATARSADEPTDRSVADVTVGSTHAQPVAARTRRSRGRSGSSSSLMSSTETPSPSHSAAKPPQADHRAPLQIARASVRPPAEIAEPVLSSAASTSAPEAVESRVGASPEPEGPPTKSPVSSLASQTAAAVVPPDQSPGGAYLRVDKLALRMSSGVETGSLLYPVLEDGRYGAFVFVAVQPLEIAASPDLAHARDEVAIAPRGEIFDWQRPGAQQPTWAGSGSDAANVFHLPALSSASVVAAFNPSQVLRDYYVIVYRQAGSTTFFRAAKIDVSRK